MAEAGGHPSGFDYLRVALALCVIFFHCIILTRAQDMGFLLHGPASAWYASVVPAFFALSGFLVMGSLERTRTVLGFAGLRVLRIFPALAVDTLVSALVLGTVLTSLPWQAYIAAPEFHRYFLNMVGDIHYTLPGVFRSNPVTRVNGQLWTIPYELECYVALAVLAVAGLHRRRRLFLAAAVAAQIASPLLESRLGHGLYSEGAAVVPSFLTGATFFLYRERIALNRWLFGLAVAATVALASMRGFTILLALPVSYATIYLGMGNPPKGAFLRTGDYSYGLYLYGSPVIQTLIATVPFARHWYTAYPLAIAATFAFAFLSWHLVEKRCLALKPLVLRLDARLARRDSRAAAAGRPCVTPPGGTSN